LPQRASILDRKGRVLAIGAGRGRRYPQGSLAGSSIGHLEPLGKEGAEEHPELDADDLVGGSGLEFGLEDALAGTPGSQITAVDVKGKVVEMLGRIRERRAKDVKTTLDIDVQKAAASGYGSTVGGAVVLDPQTGDVLAVVSSSELDPNNYVGAADVFPFNRALSGLYPPGSAMKVVTASAALDSGVVNAHTQVTGPAEYKGVVNFESGEFGTIDFGTAVQFSVNTAFAQVAEKLGAKRITKYATAFGFNESPKMPLGAATSSFPFPADAGDLLWSSVGQAQVLASPLEMASVAATVANGGRRMEPRILKNDPLEGRRVIAKRKAKTMTALMERVVQGGTGVNAQISGVRVAGKTGTAEVDVDGERKNHAWFICFAPANDPKVAVAVVSEYGGIGGQVAAPLARSILTQVLPLVK
jgi:peptidoglycan glycosyltransferase